MLVPIPKPFRTFRQQICASLQTLTHWNNVVLHSQAMRFPIRKEGEQNSRNVYFRREHDRVLQQRNVTSDFLLTQQRRRSHHLSFRLNYQ